MPTKAISQTADLHGIAEILKAMAHNERLAIAECERNENAMTIPQSSSRT